MRILVTGGQGQLGAAICRELERQERVCVAPAHQEMDVTNFLTVKECFERFRPEAVFHCAAWTAVDSAEEHPEVAMRVNGIGTRNIAEMCLRMGIRMLYISTDYVFPGTGTHYYKPDDAVGPLNVYGMSKLMGERAVRELLQNYLIVRLSWIFGAGERNFISTMIRLGKAQKRIEVVSDQIGSPTYAEDAAPLLCKLMAGSCSGIYHVTNEGICSWAELSEEVFRQTGQTVCVVPVTSARYNTQAKRPLNSRLDKQALVDSGFARLPDWRDAVSRYVKMAKEKIL